MRIAFCLAALSGLGVILSFPPFNIFPLMWISLVPLFLAIQDKSPRHGFILAFFPALLFFVESSHWLSVFSRQAWIVSAVYQAFFQAVWGFAASSVLKKEREDLLKIAFLPFSFTAMEAIRNLGPYGSPWGDLAYSQTDFLSIVQIASLTGALGVTFLVVLVNLLIYLTCIRKKWKPGLAGLFCILIPAGWGAHRLRQTFSQDQNVKIALMQTNDSQVLKWDAKHFRAMLKELDRLVQDAEGKGTDLVLFPETVLTGFLGSDPVLQNLVHSWASRLHTYMAIGTLVRKGRMLQNALVLINPEGLWTQTYVKIKLVPFGEYLPLLFRPLRGQWRILGRFAEYMPPDFIPGETPTIFQMGGRKFGAMICFESSFGWMARALVLRGAQFLAISTNDAWFTETFAQELHARMAVFRSVETERSCAQAGNTGITMILDPLGRRLLRQTPNESAVSFGKMPLYLGLTPYDRFGDVFAYFCIIFTFATIAYQSTIHWRVTGHPPAPKGDCLKF